MRRLKASATRKAAPSGIRLLLNTVHIRTAEKPNTEPTERSIPRPSSTGSSQRDKPEFDGKRERVADILK